MAQAVLRKQGNSLGLIIPAEMRGRLGFEEGQEVQVIQTANGFHVARSDETLRAFSQAAERQIRQQRDVTSRLAKYDETGILPKRDA